MKARRQLQGSTQEIMGTDSWLSSVLPSLLLVLQMTVDFKKFLALYMTAFPLSIGSFNMYCLLIF